MSLDLDSLRSSVGALRGPLQPGGPGAAAQGAPVDPGFVSDELELSDPAAAACAVEATGQAPAVTPGAVDAMVEELIARETHGQGAQWDGRSTATTRALDQYLDALTAVRKLLQRASHLVGPSAAEKVADRTGQVVGLREQVLSGLFPRPTPPLPFAGQRVLSPEDVENPSRAAAALGRMLGAEGMATVALLAAAAERDPALARNLGTLTMVLDQAISAPDYARHPGSGFSQFPVTREHYLLRQFNDRRGVGVERAGRTLAAVNDTLGKLTASGELSAESIGTVAAWLFVSEVGASSRALWGERWTPEVEAVRTLVESHALVPLRALNELSAEAFGDHKVIHGKLRGVISEITRAMVEGRYEDWRTHSPTSRAQLEGASEQVLDQWFAARSVTQRDGPVKLTTRIQNGPERLWLTKVRGPSHGFDYGPHCLLAYLSNVRDHGIVVYDPAFTEGPAARAYVRLLRRDDGEFELFLEATQVDYTYERQMKGKWNAGVRDPDATSKAIIRHAVDLARDTGLTLALTPGQSAVAEQMGLLDVDERETRHYVLDPSGGIVMASDALGAHDWVATEPMLSKPVKNAGVIDPAGLR